MNKLKFYGTASLIFQEAILEELKLVNLSFESQIEIYFDTTNISYTENSFRVLILLEPPSVMPENYIVTAIDKFDLVIPLSPWRSAVMGLSQFAFQPIDQPVRCLNDEQKKHSLVFVNALKFGAVSSSLYGWRLKILDKLEASGMTVEVYGSNWSMSKLMEIRKRLAATRRATLSKDFDLLEAWSSLFYRPKIYRGQTPDKFATISGYTFALIVENDLHSLTEKIFDALYSGAIVFYRGPNLSSYTNLARYCFELPKGVDEAVSLIREVMESPKSSLVPVSRDIIEDSSFMAPFSLANTAHTLALSIASAINSFHA
jgi:hypothetical protein